MKHFTDIATVRHILTMTIVILVALTIQSVIFLNIVTAEIPGLKAQITREDKAISDDNYIINEEAVPTIIRLAKQVKSLGGDPGTIQLKAPGQ